MSSEFHAVKGRLPATPTSLKSTTFSFGLENFGINPWCVGSLDNSFGSDWGMDVENGFEGGGKLICKVCNTSQRSFSRLNNTLRVLL